MTTPRLLGALALGAFVLCASSVEAQSATASHADSARAAHRDSTSRRDSLAAAIEQLEARVTALEKSIGATAAPARGPSVSASREGLAVASADGAFAFRLRGYVQADGRFFGASGAVSPGASTFLLRRARLIFDATAYKYFALRLAPDFGNGQAVLFDAYVDARANAALGLRAGKFRSPLGLERQIPASDQRFIERGLPSMLVPNRDVGVLISGDLATAHVQYALGVLDGAPDGANIDGDAATGKDVVGRVLVRPFATSPRAIDVGIGVAGSSGTEQGSPGAPALGVYRSAGQLALFRFRSDGTAANTTIADGRRTRVAPQGYAYIGPAGMLAEYTRVTHGVRRATSSAALTNEAWQLSAAWMVSGERETFGALAPRHPVDGSTSGGVGALEVAARYGVLTTDADAFPTYADPVTQARRARATGVGVNWRLTRGVVVSVDYERTQLDGPDAGVVRSTEHDVLTRLQLGF
ncbi:MAG: OprO/OprP family phosphate-selective porin [Gemmatimonadaceae bacterium]